jgi:copper(I)-binding protein
MRSFRTITIFILIGMVLIACTSQTPSIEIEEAWARPGAIGENTAIYFQITSFGADDAIIRGEALVASITELHRSTMNEDGTMSMIQQTDIPLPQDETVELKPGGLHVMLMQLTKDLEPGDELTLKLYFAEQGEMEINVPVKTP